MSASAHAFDENLAKWKAELRRPWMTLRYKLEQAHIRRHVPEEQLHILDAGGGNGRHAIAFAKQGHTVALVDFSTEMLADARRAAEQEEVIDRVEFYHADVAEIPHLFSGSIFDLVLCHNVIQYIDDVPALLRAIRAPLRATGILSLVTVNGHSEVYKAAFRELDLEKAHAQLHGSPTHATVFGAPIRRFTEAELNESLQAAGFAPTQRYGVRSVCDWLPNEPKSDPDFMERLTRLELALATEYPYYLLARYWQIIATPASIVGG